MYKLQVCLLITARSQLYSNRLKRCDGYCLAFEKNFQVLRQAPIRHTTFMHEVNLSSKPQGDQVPLLVYGRQACSSAVNPTSAA